MSSWTLTLSDVTSQFFNLESNQVVGNADTTIRIRDEIEAQWDETFANSLDLLERLSNEALTDYHEGRTQPLIPDEL